MTVIFVKPENLQRRSCETCMYKKMPAGGWCYMFKDEPKGYYCLQYRKYEPAHHMRGEDVSQPKEGK